MSLSSKNFVFICLTMITRSYILNIKLVQYRSYSSLYDNKSFSSKYNQKSGSDSSASITKDSIVQQPNQYDIKRMQFQAKLGLSLEDPRFIVNNVNVKKVEVVKTGAELRKERKLQGKNKDKSINKKQNENAKTSDVSTRFILGNGVEGLSVQSLLGLVKSTAPYYFPEMMVKAVVDEDVFFEVDNYYERGTQPHDTTSSDENKQFETPWEQIFHDTEVVFNKKQPNSQAISSEEDRIQYFKLCIASHFATVATYVPTDVDSKIRGHCWNDPSPYVIESQYLHLKDAMLNWNPADVSSRVIFINGDPLSGHDGEWLGTLFGALGAMLRVGNKQYAREIEELIEVELARETSYFRKLYMSKASTQTDTIILKAAAIICHNVGDCDQGLSYWNNATMTNDMQRIFHQYSRLAHERYDRFNGEFGKAKLIYSKLLSAEGHRNYPLREAKCLRQHADLMLPINPFLENWGRGVMQHELLSYQDKLLVMRQLLRGCDSQSRAWCVPGQVGYYRALYGMQSAGGGDFDKMIKDLDHNCVRVLKEHDMRFHMSLPDDAFAGRLGKQMRELLGQT